jgi:uncharacterized protein involved in type VI secretion and phage assembly
MSLSELFGNDSGQINDKIAGVIPAIVTSLDDPEKLCRVKVKFPVRDCEEEGYWARVATLMAGKERGSFFLPDVEDEVLVAFEEGEISKPYIIGCLWNKEDKPPVTDGDEKNNIKKIMSRSGHEIIFGDDSENKKEMLEIRTKAGHVILLDDSSGSEKVEIKDKSGSNSIVIDSSQNAMTIQCAGQLSIKAKMIAIEAETTMNVKSGAAAEIKSDATLDIKADATMVIKGTLVQIN